MPPTPVAVMPVMAPSHLFGLEPSDLVTRRHGGAHIFVHAGSSILVESLGRKRRSVHTRGQRSGACCKSNREFQKVPAFHNVFLLSQHVMRGELDPAEMNAR
jgi:hypothetical protein